MSERILKALMQLFAIIAHPESRSSDRRAVVESFLQQQLNQELVDEYLHVYEDYYIVLQQQPLSSEKRVKRTSSSSVKVLRICTAINEELTQKQKIIVLILLLEFIKAENLNEITEQEQEFVSMVADTFHIQLNNYQLLSEFVLGNFADVPDSSNILIIDDKAKYYLPKVKHQYRESFAGQIRVLNIVFSNMYIIKYFGENEMYLNGQLLKKNKVYVLSPGASIRNSIIKPIYYSDLVSAFISDNIKTGISFEAKNIEYYFKNGAIGLHEMSFYEESGKLVGIMGASGTGKSTLLNVLNGSALPTKGEVLINAIDIHTDKANIEGIIGHVSQDDLLIEELTVFQNLYYNAKLCFDNYTEFQIIRTVLKLLQSLGLYEIKHMKVGSPLNKKISGGQRKRLNIALELIREPSVLFLDEPTSGLSSRDSENILDLLKELTLKGKLVFVVIHQPSSDIFKMFDKLLILDRGGFLVYDGDPVESIIYFKSRIHQADWNESECHVCGNVNPEQIFNIVESQVIDEYGNLTHTRRKSPKEWHNHFKEFQKHEPINEDEIKELPPITFRIPNSLKQFWVFVKRDVLSKLANTQYLFINLFETPLLALLLSYIIKYYNVDVANEYGYTFSENSNVPVYIFMSVIIAMFIGLTVSAEEIIKDRKILKRESFLNLSRSSYLLSKVAILLGISAYQSLIYVLIGNSIIEIKGMYLEYWLVLFSTWTCSCLLGLNISDSFRTSITIYILIPFLIIPQIILSGILVKYDKLNPTISAPNSIPFYGEVITARWAYEALAVRQFVTNKYEQRIYGYDKIMSNSEFKKNYLFRTLDNKIVNCERNFSQITEKVQIISDLNLIRNEITKEMKVTPIIPFTDLNNIYYDKLTPAIINSVRNYFDLVTKYYIKRYNSANKEKDNIVSKFQKTQDDKDKFVMLKKHYHNEGLEELVRNSNDLTRIMEYNGTIYQKNDPIFQDPVSPFGKAHFYAPRKKVISGYVDTFWFNIWIIWLMTGLLYWCLYNRGIYKLLEYFASYTSRIFKKDNIYTPVVK